MSAAGPDRRRLVIWAAFRPLESPWAGGPAGSATRSTTTASRRTGRCAPPCPRMRTPTSSSSRASAASRDKPSAIARDRLSAAGPGHACRGRHRRRSSPTRPTTCAHRAFFGGLWRWALRRKLDGPALAGMIINVRNAFQVWVSVDHRYGPIYSRPPPGLFLPRAVAL
ncbi:MAG: hypothetical protein R2838_17660 [Caldilineaceae bacterium]